MNFVSRVITASFNIYSDWVDNTSSKPPHRHEDNPHYQAIKDRGNGCPATLDNPLTVNEIALKQIFPLLHRATTRFELPESTFEKLAVARLIADQNSSCTEEQIVDRQLSYILQINQNLIETSEQIQLKNYIMTEDIKKILNKMARLELKQDEHKFQLTQILFLFEKEILALQNNVQLNFGDVSTPSNVSILLNTGKPVKETSITTKRIKAIGPPEYD